MSLDQNHPDYIIIGGGSAGCVLAARLSADPDCHVVLLEAGGEDINPLIHIPAGYIKTMVNPAMNWMFETEPEDSSGNRRIAIPRGKVLGGSSAINAMLYVRGQAADYDGWAQRGNLGWSYDDVLPYFRKAENCEQLSKGDEGFDSTLRKKTRFAFPPKKLTCNQLENGQTCASSPMRMSPRSALPANAPTGFITTGMANCITSKPGVR